MVEKFYEQDVCVVLGRKIVKWFFIWLFIFVINTILFTVICDWLIVGFAMPKWKKEPAEEHFLLRKKNRMELQKSTECAGFSSAHVLRSYGIEADGNDMYAKMPGKLPGGAVLPKNLKKVLKKRGFRVSFRRGNLDSLKAELCKGNRVIVFIRTFLGKKYLHYVPVVGYDEKEIFLADSMGSLINCKEEFFNRRLPYEEFMKYWNIREWYMPFYKNTYLVIEKKDSQNREFSSEKE